MVLPLLYAVYRTDLSSNMDEENPTCDCVGLLESLRFLPTSLVVLHTQELVSRRLLLSTDKPSPRHTYHPILILDW